MTELIFSRKVFLKKKKEALTKVNSFSENFKKRETKVKADSDEAIKVWAELSKKFKWWHSLP